MSVYENKWGELCDVINIINLQCIKEGQVPSPFLK